MVGQGFLKFGNILKQSIDTTRWQFSKRLVGWGKNGEWPRTFNNTPDTFLREKG
jgi:hypothetical protein